jgi:hypothetical protein
MSFLWSRKQPKIDPALLEQLERIREIKDGFRLSERGACNALGLYVQYQLIPPPPVKSQKSGNHAEDAWRNFIKYGTGVETLQAGSRASSYVDVWRESFSSDAWKIEKYQSGEWEVLVQPTVRLAEWLNDWGGLSDENKTDFQSAVTKFKEVRQLGLILRAERCGRLCGRCGTEVMNLEEHLKGFHIHPGIESRLSVFVEVRKGIKALNVAQSGTHQEIRHVSPELHDFTWLCCMNNHRVRITTITSN